MTPDRKRLMTKLLAYIRANAIALCALFIALGGTSYAAITIPRNSIGNRQLKNHSVTPVKLDGGKTAGYVLDWAQIATAGIIESSRPRGARLLRWDANPNSPFPGGSISWPNKIPNACFPVVSASGYPSSGPRPASVSAELEGPIKRPFVTIQESGPTSLNVAVICPIP